MAQIIIAGNALVITSSQTLEAIKTAEKHRPKALELCDEKGQTIFKVGTTAKGGSINKYGASFGNSTYNADGLATITMTLPENIENVIGYVAEEYSAAIIALNKVEQNLESAIAEISAELAEVMSNIVTV